jgi:hypothetical protein
MRWDDSKPTGLATRCGPSLGLALGTIRAPAGRRQTVALPQAAPQGAGEWLGSGNEIPVTCANFTPKSRLHLENRAMVLPAP